MGETAGKILQTTSRTYLKILHCKNVIGIK